MRDAEDHHGRGAHNAQEDLGKPDRRIGEESPIIGKVPETPGLDALRRTSELPAASWRSMTGQTVQALGEPAESSVYFFQHHRYDLIDLEILEQRDRDIHVQATLTGDLDCLGIDPVTADAWLRFDGIRVSVSDASTAESALARLEAFTDIDGLASSATAIHSAFHFRPMDS